MNCRLTILTFAINLTKWMYRRASVVPKFKRRNEFQLAIVPVATHRAGAIDFWQTICEIIQQASKVQLSYISCGQNDFGYLDISVQELKTVDYCKLFAESKGKLANTLTIDDKGGTKI